MDAWVQDGVRALRRILDARDAYGVFELWEGCGKDVVRDTFYQYVKDFHPDRFGASDPAVKQLAEEAFIRINSSYTQLLSKEREQRVPPPASHAAAQAAPSPSAPSLSAPTREAGRPIMHTPTPPAAAPSNDARAAKLARLRAGSTTPVEPAITSLAEESSTSEEERAAKLARLANRRKRPSAEDLIDQINTIRQPEPAPAAAPPPTEEDRRSKLARLAQKSRGNMLIVEDDEDDDIPLADASNSSVGHIPQQVLAQALRGVELNTADDFASRSPRDLFNEGYKDFKLKRYEQALRLFRAAHEREPADGLYMTFFGYSLFLVHPDQIQTAEDKLRAAIESEHRQALPDAHLFMGYVLEKQGKSARALRHFERAHELNPASRDAERQLRLYQMRQAREQEDGSGDLLSKLFKK